MAKKSSGPGRPALQEQQRKNRNITFRARGDLRDRLEVAARETGRSISEEIERRLERSFLDQRLMLDALELAYGKGLADILRVIGEAMRCAGYDSAVAVTGRPISAEGWWQMPYSFDQAARSAAFIIQALRPCGNVEQPSHLQTPPPAYAADLLDALAKKGAPGHDSPRIVALRESISPDLLDHIEKAAPS